MVRLYKLCLFMHHIHIGQAPQCLSDGVSKASEAGGRYRLRSTGSAAYVLPRTRTRFGEREQRFNGSHQLFYFIFFIFSCCFKFTLCKHVRLSYVFLINLLTYQWSGYSWDSIAHQSLCLSSMIRRTLHRSLFKTTLWGTTALVTLAAAELAAAAACDSMPRVIPCTLDRDGKLGGFEMLIFRPMPPWRAPVPVAAVGEGSSASRPSR